MSSLLSSREQCLDLANDIGKTCRICGGANHANLLKGTDKKTGTREPINRCITYLCSFLSNTFYKETKWLEIAVFLYIVIFFQWIPRIANIIWKNGFLFQAKMKENKC